MYVTAGVCTDIRQVGRHQCENAQGLSLEFFQAIMPITLKQQVLDESITSKRWSFGKLVL